MGPAGMTNHDFSKKRIYTSWMVDIYVMINWKVHHHGRWTFRSIGVPNNTTIPHRFPLRTRVTLGRFQGDFAHCFWTAEWVYRKLSECGFSQDFLWYEPTQRHGDRRPQLPSNFTEDFPLKSVILSLEIPWNRSISILSTSDSYCEKYIESHNTFLIVICGKYIIYYISSKYVINDHPTIQKMFPAFPNAFSFKAGIESAVYMAYEETVGSTTVEPAWCPALILN